jgi:DNA-binding NarL/FixJ family response regulator
MCLRLRGLFPARDDVCAGLVKRSRAMADFHGAEEFMVPKIVIVDDHDVVRQGVRSIIARARPDWDICGEGANGEQALRAVKGLNPDLVVLDVTMPVMNGLEAASKIVKASPGCRVLILTMHESDRLCADIRLVGAHGYVQKSHVGRDLVYAIECLLTGGTFFGPEAKDRNERSPARNPNISFFAGVCSATFRARAFGDGRVAALSY